jgi:hypothetical protein
MIGDVREDEPALARELRVEAIELEANPTRSGREQPARSCVLGGLTTSCFADENRADFN